MSTEKERHVAYNATVFTSYKLLTHAYGTESQLASQGGGLRPEVNIGPNKQINNMSWEHN